MGTRGRKSQAALTVVDNSSVLTIPRAGPPEKLTPEQAEYWRLYTNRMPADYFGAEHYAHLAQLCRELVLADRINQALEVETSLASVLELGKAQNRQSQIIDRLQRSMRLTHQSNVRAECSRIPTIEHKPLWENY